MKEQSKKENILKYWARGRSKRAIATIVGCSRAYVYEILTKEGLYPPKETN